MSFSECPLHRTPGQDVKEASLGIKFSVFYCSLSSQTGLHPLLCAHFLTWSVSQNSFLSSHSELRPFRTWVPEVLIPFCLYFAFLIACWPGTCLYVLCVRYSWMYSQAGKCSLGGYMGSRFGAIHAQLYFFISISSLDLSLWRLTLYFI